MKPTIKSIPTEYNGTLFRSKLEARTAKLLDRDGVEWVYEPEGLDCFGTWYLPDFFLPSINTFIEVKGVVDHDALKKVDALARAANGLPAAGVFGFDPADWKQITHVVMVEPRNVDAAERGERLSGRYAPSSDAWGVWFTGEFCVSPGTVWSPGDATLERCSACRAYSFNYWPGLWRCAACGRCGKPSRRHEDTRELSPEVAP
jgi:hypothetical protein